AWSVAVTTKVWGPSASPARLTGLLADVGGPASRLYRNARPPAFVTASVAPKAKEAEVSVVCEAGALVSETAGAVASTTIGSAVGGLHQECMRPDRQAGEGHRAGRRRQGAAVEAVLQEQAGGRGDGVRGAEGEGRRGVGRLRGGCARQRHDGRRRVDDDRQRA